MLQTFASYTMPDKTTTMEAASTLFSKHQEVNADVDSIETQQEQVSKTMRVDLPGMCRT